MLNRIGLLGIVLATLVFAFTGVASAQGKLEVGDAAPGLDIKKWFNGDATTIKTGQTYVVEFWATWCGPCKKSIPHLNELSQKFGPKGLTIIGVSDESPETVQPFVTAQGERMSYLVACDRDKATSRAWMQAAGQKGIPCAFVVDKNSKIVYIGHPLDPEFEQVLRLTLVGRYDPKKAKAAKPVIEAADRAAKIKNWRQAYKHLDEVIAMDRNVFAPVVRRKFEMMLAEEKNADAAYAYLAEQIKEYSSDPDALRMFAMDITTNPKYENRNMDLALAAAEASVQAAGAKNPDALATVALVQFHRGDSAEAVERQMEAWMIAPPSEKAEFRRVLDNYRAAVEKSRASAK